MAVPPLLYRPCCTAGTHQGVLPVKHLLPQPHQHGAQPPRDAARPPKPVGGGRPGSCSAGGCVACLLGRTEAGWLAASGASRQPHQPPKHQPSRASPAGNRSRHPQPQQSHQHTHTRATTQTKSTVPAKAGSRHPHNRQQAAGTPHSQAGPPKQAPTPAGTRQQAPGTRQALPSRHTGSRHPPAGSPHTQHHSRQQAPPAGAPQQVAHMKMRVSASSRCCSSPYRKRVTSSRTCTGRKKERKKGRKEGRK